MKRWLLPILLAGASVAGAQDIRIGLLGLDTSHVIQFSKLFNDPSNPAHVAGARIVAAWKGGSADVEDSASRVDGFTAQVQKDYGIKVMATIPEVCRAVDAIMITSVDGRPHLEEARQALPFHKPVFIDKPMAGSLRDAIEIFRLARKEGTPCFSSSDECFTSDITALRQAPIGKLLGVYCYGPAALEPHHPDMFWYGIHAVTKA
jgi:predicted dehydrogenase